MCEAYRIPLLTDVAAADPSLLYRPREITVHCSSDEVLQVPREVFAGLEFFDNSTRETMADRTVIDWTMHSHLTAARWCHLRQGLPIQPLEVADYWSLHGLASYAGDKHIVGVLEYSFVLHRTVWQTRGGVLPPNFFRDLQSAECLAVMPQFMRHFLADRDPQHLLDAQPLLLPVHRLLYAACHTPPGKAARELIAPLLHDDRYNIFALYQTARLKKASLTPAAELGHGLAIWQTKKRRNNLRLLPQLAEKLVPGAMYRLGKLMIEGSRVEADPDQGQRLMQEAAGGGSYAACLTLARNRLLDSPTRFSYALDGWRLRCKQCVRQAFTILAEDPTLEPPQPLVDLGIEMEIPEAFWQEYKHSKGGIDQLCRAANRRHILAEAELAGLPVDQQYLGYKRLAKRGCETSLGYAFGLVTENPHLVVPAWLLKKGLDEGYFEAYWQSWLKTSDLTDLEWAAKNGHKLAIHELGLVLPRQGEWPYGTTYCEKLVDQEHAEASQLLGLRWIGGYRKNTLRGYTLLLGNTHPDVIQAVRGRFSCALRTTVPAQEAEGIRSYLLSCSEDLEVNEMRLQCLIHGHLGFEQSLETAQLLLDSMPLAKRKKEELQGALSIEQARDFFAQEDYVQARYRLDVATGYGCTHSPLLAAKIYWATDSAKLAASAYLDHLFLIVARPHGRLVVHGKLGQIQPVFVEMLERCGEIICTGKLRPRLMRIASLIAGTLVPSWYCPRRDHTCIAWQPAFRIITDHDVRPADPRYLYLAGSAEPLFARLTPSLGDRQALSVWLSLAEAHQSEAICIGYLERTESLLADQPMTSGDLLRVYSLAEQLDSLPLYQQFIRLIRKREGFQHYRLNAYTEAAKLGDPNAMNWLAKRLVKTDPAAACRLWLEAAQEHNLNEAASNLAYHWSEAIPLLEEEKRRCREIASAHGTCIIS